jgi:hypothetical protein
MAGSRNFYFGKDADIVAGAANFAAKIATGFASYGISNAQSTAFGALNTTLQDKYTAAITPSTRTPVAVQEKNVARNAMRANAVMLAKICYGTPTVNDAMLVDLGLLPRPTNSTRPVPDEPPVVEYVSCKGRLATFRLHGAPPDTRRGKPFGAQCAQIFSFPGDAPPDDPRLYHFEGSTTRTEVEILFPDSIAAGTTIWISACWVSNRSERGMGSTPISFTLQGGAIPAAA